MTDDSANLPDIASASEQVLTSFRHQLAAEGLSLHTRKAYLTDAAALAAWAAPRALLALSSEDLAAYLASPGVMAKSPRSIARLQSALRHLWRGLMARAQAIQDPTIGLERDRRNPARRG